MQNTQVPLEVIRGLQLADLAYLAEWTQRQIDLGQFPSFANWLHRWAVCEVGNRQCESYELGSLPLPEELWSGSCWSDALLGSFLLSKHPCTLAIAAFADQLHLRVMCAVGAILAELNFSITEE